MGTSNLEPVQPWAGLDEVEQYPSPDQPAPAWAAQRRRRYRAELDRLFVAGQISQRDLDRTLEEREAAAERYTREVLTRQASAPATMPAAAAQFPSYTDAELDTAGEPAEGWR